MIFLLAWFVCSVISAGLMNHAMSRYRTYSNGDTWMAFMMGVVGGPIGILIGAGECRAHKLGIKLSYRFPEQSEWSDVGLLYMVRKWAKMSLPVMQILSAAVVSAAAASASHHMWVIAIVGITYSLFAAHLADDPH